MIPRLFLYLCLALTACSRMPVVPWPDGTAGPTPALLPLDALIAPALGTAEARGAALAAKAAALRARTAR
jgi:hypothetical protein